MYILNRAATSHPDHEADQVDYRLAVDVREVYAGHHPTREAPVS